MKDEPRRLFTVVDRDDEVFSAEVIPPRSSIKTAAEKSPKSTANLSSWRVEDDVRVWLASSKPDSGHRDVDGKAYEFPGTIPNGKQQG